MIKDDASVICFEKLSLNIELSFGVRGNCFECNSKISSDISFVNEPNFLFIETYPYEIYIHELPKTITIKGKNYKLLCSTISHPGHFISVFDFMDNFYIVDDLFQSFNFLPPLEPQKSNENTRQYENNNPYYKKSKTNFSMYFLI